MTTNGGPEEVHHVLPDYARAGEALGPAGQLGAVQPVLDRGEGEGEAQVVRSAQQVVVHHELPQLVRHEVEQLLPGPGHQVLAHRVLGGGHSNTAAVGVKLDQYYSKLILFHLLREIQTITPEVGSPQVESQVLSCLPSSGQLGDVGDVGLDVGGGVGVPAQAPVDLHHHPLLNMLELLVTETEVRAHLLDLAELELLLLGPRTDGLRAEEELPGQGLQLAGLDLLQDGVCELRPRREGGVLSLQEREGAGPPPSRPCPRHCQHSTRISPHCHDTIQVRFVRSDPDQTTQ